MILTKTLLALSVQLLSLFDPCREFERALSLSKSLLHSVNRNCDTAYLPPHEVILVDNASYNRKAWPQTSNRHRVRSVSAFWGNGDAMPMLMIGKGYRNLCQAVWRNAEIEMRDVCSSSAKILEGNDNCVTSILKFNSRDQQRAFSLLIKPKATLGYSRSRSCGHCCPCCENESHDNRSNFQAIDTHGKARQPVRFFNLLDSRPLGAKISIIPIIGALAVGIIGAGSWLAIFHPYRIARYSGWLIFSLGIGALLSLFELIITSP